jgi:hypothetical protein
MFFFKKLLAQCLICMQLIIYEGPLILSCMFESFSAMRNLQLMEILRLKPY